MDLGEDNYSDSDYPYSQSKHKSCSKHSGGGRDCDERANTISLVGPKVVLVNLDDATQCE